MVKAKRKTKRGKGNDGTLETLLRFEIIVVLFSLIGLYYFLSFSPIRMPAEPLASPPEMIAPLPPQPETEVKSEVEVGKPAVDSGSGQVTVVAELPVTQPLVASVSVANIEADSQSEASSQVAETSASEMSGKSEVPALAKRELPNSPLTKILAETSVAASHDEPVPEPAVSPSASALVPVTASPLPQAHTALASPLKENQPQFLPPRTIVAGDYVLQVDVLGNRQKLESLKFKVGAETVRRPTPMYRVYLGTFPRHKKALEIMDIVRKKGDEPFLQSCSGGYNVVIGSFYLHSSVVAWENLYHAAGFEPKVQEVTLPMPHTLLLLDGPEVQRDPDAVLVRLQAAGFADPHLK